MAKELNKDDVNEIYRILTERIVDDDEDETPEETEHVPGDGDNELSDVQGEPGDTDEPGEDNAPVSGFNQGIGQTGEENAGFLFGEGDNEAETDKNAVIDSIEESAPEKEDALEKEPGLDGEVYAENTSREQSSPAVEIASAIDDIERKLGAEDSRDEPENFIETVLAAGTSEENPPKTEKENEPPFHAEQVVVYEKMPEKEVFLQDAEKNKEPDRPAMPETHVWSRGASAIEKNDKKTEEKYNHQAGGCVNNLKGDGKMEKKNTWKVVVKEQFVDVSCGEMALSLMKGGKNQVKVNGVTFIMDGDTFYWQNEEH